MLSVTKFIKRYCPQYLVLPFLFLVIVCPSLFLGWLKQDRALIHAFDTGIYLQILSNLSSGLGWASSITGEQNFLAHHFQPIVAMFVPFFYFSPTPLMLFLISAASALATVWILWRSFSRLIPNFYLVSVCALVLYHPTVFSRMMHSFVPEIVALPALTALAICLVKGRKFLGASWPIFLVIILVAGLSKETVWPCLAFSCFLHGLKWRNDRLGSWSISLACLVIFCFLFLYWMPLHTNMPSYYGLRYYLSSGSPRPRNIYEWLVVLSGNLFSLRSVDTLINAIGLPLFFLPLLGPGVCLVAAIPGMTFILLSTHMAVHHPGNQYQILVLPYLFVAMLGAIESKLFFRNLRVKRWVPVFLLLPTLLLHYIPMYVGTVQHIMTNDFAKYVSRDLAVARDEVLRDRSAVMIVDANLQPFLFDYSNLRVLLPFLGNPMPMSRDDFKNADFIVTLVDVRSLDCRSVLAKPGSESLQYDYEAFYAYCDAIKDNTGLLPKSYADSGLVIYKMKP